MNGYHVYNTGLPRVTEFEIVDKHTIRVKFHDATERVINLEPILNGPVFGPLRDPFFFSQVRLDADFGTLEWPNGADIDPTVLHDWPEYVDVIIQKHRELLAVPA